MRNRKIAILLIAVIMLMSSFHVPAIVYGETASSEYIVINDSMLIATSDNPTLVESTAANELKTYFSKINENVSLNIVKESNVGASKAIFVGATGYAASNNVAYTGTDTMGEGWVYKVVDGNLVLNGGEQRGVLYAVYHLLEDEFGVHWWNLREEYVPSLTTIQLPIDLAKSGKPYFTYRDMYDLAQGDRFTSENSIEDPDIWSKGYVTDIDQETEGLSLFYVRNRMNGEYGYTSPAYGGVESIGRPYHTHTAARYFPTEKYYATNPEYYALVGGVRDSSHDAQMCLNDPNISDTLENDGRDGLLTAYIKKLKTYIRESEEKALEKGQPKPRYYSITMNDNTNRCQCEYCINAVSQYGLSGNIINFVNKIADSIKDEYPDIKIETLAYWNYLNLPKGNVFPRDNVMVRLAENYVDLLRDMDHPYNADKKRRLGEWSNYAKQSNPDAEFHIWDYAVNYNVNSVMPSVFNYGSYFKAYRDAGATGYFVETENAITTDFWDMKEWMQIKLMEDPGLDQDALINTFINGYYGEAARYIKPFLKLAKEKLDESNIYVSFITDMFAPNSNYIDYEMVIEGDKLFNLAIDAIQDNPTLLKRVRKARSCFDKAIAWNYASYKSDAEENGIDLVQLNIVREEVAQRVVDTLNEQIADNCPDHSSENHYSSICAPAVKEIDVFSNIAQEKTKLPDELKNVDKNKIHDFLFTGPAATGGLVYNDIYGLNLVNDEKSLFGKSLKTNMITQEQYNAGKGFANAYYYILTDSNSMGVGIYGAGYGGLPWGSNYIPLITKDNVIPDDEYHYYKAENVMLVPSDDVFDRLFVGNDWGIAQWDAYNRLKHLYNKPVDIYLHARISGNVFEQDPDNLPVYYRDRLIIVEKSSLTGTVEIDNTAPKSGDVLTATYTGTEEVTYQWNLDNNPIVGAIGQTYTVEDSDIGKSITVTITLSDGGLSTTSASTAAVISNTIPEELRNIDPSKIIEFRFDIVDEVNLWYPASYGHSLVDDPLSLLGKAIKTETMKNYEFGNNKGNAELYLVNSWHNYNLLFMGLPDPPYAWNNFAVPIITNTAISEMTDIETKYHLYKAENVTIPSETFSKISFAGDQSISINNADSRLSDLKGKQVDVYLSARLEGDVTAYVVGDVVIPPTYYMDRLFFVGKEPQLEGNLSIDNLAPKFGDTLIATYSGDESNLIYQWKANGIDIGGAAGSNYTINDPSIIGKKVTVKAYNDNGMIISTETLPVIKTDAPAAPPAPEVLSVTDTSVTLKAVLGCEYSKDGLSWQNSNKFIGLNANTTYSFTQRVAESATHKASTPSENLTVTTLDYYDPTIATVTSVSVYS